MFEKVSFDVRLGVVRRKSKYDAEYDALHDFISSDHSNVVFGYSNKVDARNAHGWLQRLIKEERLPVEAHVYEVCNVLIERKEKGGVKI